METRSEFSVTLSDELFDHLRLQAQRLHVPLRWLVASLVCDTIETSTTSMELENATSAAVRAVA